MRRVTLGQPVAHTEGAFRTWALAAIKEIEQASHIPDTGASQMTAVGLFVAYSANGSFR